MNYLTIYISWADSPIAKQPQFDYFFIAVFFALIPIVAAFSFIVFLFYRQRREAYFREAQLEFKLEKADLKMKALKSQVNPHFIFNCLNSIQHFIHKNKSELAENYLIKFSRLIRLVLENSTFHMVTISDDLKALELYIQMEQMRLNHSFDYEINTSDLDIESMCIPPLIIQPFVENSIWHGLTNVTNGVVKISFLKKKDELLCWIEDNGKTKTKKEKQEYKNQSLGLSLIKQRLELLQKLHKTNYSFNIQDIHDELNRPCGKKIELILPFE